jgi:hypothetical protein
MSDQDQLHVARLAPIARRPALEKSLL